VADVVVSPADPKVLREQLGQFDVYLASLHVRLDGETIAGAERLKAIVTPSTGSDHIDIPAATRRGIPVLTLKDDRAFIDTLTDQTRGMIGREQFAKMKRGAVLINTSRGAIIDEAALLDALSSGALLGAGLDVIDGEWRKDLDQHPLIRYAATHQNLVISPHI